MGGGEWRTSLGGGGVGWRVGVGEGWKAEEEAAEAEGCALCASVSATMVGLEEELQMKRQEEEMVSQQGRR